MSIQKKYFSRYKKPLADLTPFTEMQINSFKWFLNKGFSELLKDFSPINDYTEKELSLEFTGYSIDKPKHDEYFAKNHNLDYAAPLKVEVQLVNKTTGEVKKQEVFLCDMPLMTQRGTFIVNGVERAIVAQLIRSFGAYFTLNILKGRKYFGAKIIPSRGVWLEIETESDGVIYARIDRKRKFPVSTLLKIFKMTSAEILDYFKNIDTGEISFISNTLEKDSTKDINEAYIEIFKRVRPGELATLDNAKGLLENMFNEARYDLSIVGRYKLNQRVGLSLENIENQPRTISLNDLLLIIKQIIKSNNDPAALADDIDHLGNRRVRGVGEMLRERLRIGMTRMKRIIQDRMSTLDIDTVTPIQLINASPFMAVVKEFFMTSQLSQFMNQKNILDELEHLRRLSALGPGGLIRERAGFEVRDVHPSHYGRICPIETPEGPSIGLVVHLALFARLNDLGILQTPYRKVINGRITSEIVYLDALEESKYNIAHAGIEYDEEGNIIDDDVEGRIKGNPSIISKDKVDFIDVMPSQAFSVATNLIPFLDHDDANRALMGSNMQRQAVPCIKPEAPLVATGLEEKVARDSGRLIIAEDSGEIVEIDASKIVVKTKDDKEKTYNLINFIKSNDFTLIHQKPIVNKGDFVKKGDVLADASSSDQSQLALGQNVLVAFLSLGGNNFEDAIIISQRLVKKDIFTSIHIEDFSVAVRDTKLGPEITTYDIPNIGEEKLKNLDEEGIIRIGAEVSAGDILVGKISPKGEAELTPEERLLRAIFGEKARDIKDTSLTLPHGKHGKVISVKVFSREKGDKLETGVIKQIHVEIAQIRKISVGDKLAGRHGNKGVISKILPEEDMPYLEDGTPVDVVLNPLGVASRMNIGQILETHLGMTANKLGYQAVVPPFQGATDNEVHEELNKAGMPSYGKVALYDGRTGERFDQEVTIGYMYIMKLIHMVEDKLHMRSIGSYSLITQQPLGGKAQGGGQRFGEMEVWALEGYGAAYTLQEMLTIKSDDVLGRVSAYDAIVRGEEFKAPHLPASFNVLVNELKGLALDIELVGRSNEQEIDEESLDGIDVSERNAKKIKTLK
jgi:DNA-directed RNA polymerase subunit beta